MELIQSGPKHWPRHRLKERSCDEILPNLWLGGISALHLNHFDAVVSAIKTEDLRELELDVTYWLRVPLIDAPNSPIEFYFQGVAHFIHAHLTLKHKVLIHCKAGHSRSVTLLAWYLIKYHNMEADEALTFIKKKRPTINPNEGFYKKLKYYENAGVGNF